ncbi:MAG: DUF4381 domain-containing protein [Magnetococcales bacterium]|nr:DUF4381 domain-containing protein [Magnetococcales bacterium]
MNPSPLPLRDIHLPEPLSWWPPALGWWLIIGALALIVMGYWAWRVWRARHRYRDAALRELARIRAAHAQQADPARLAADLSALLRRVCLRLHPTQPVASLTGAAWLELLERTTPNFSLSKAGGQPLIRAPFEPNPSCDPETLLNACQGWIQALPPVPIAKTTRKMENFR